METPLNEGLRALTEREKQTLRLMVRGHDAKSIARNLDLSVHTINERLRDARRKLAVSSSREAARILFDAEDCDVPPLAPNFLGDRIIGEDAPAPRRDQESTPVDGGGPARRRSRIVFGACLMTFAIGLLMLLASPQAPTTPSAPPAAAPIPTAATNGTSAADVARNWLVLLDQSRWEDSYQRTGTSFRKLNTLQVWTAASEEARTPLGAMLSRTFVSQENLPAPPAGYEVLKFRTRFANKVDALETVSLDREDGIWRVVGVTIG